MMRKIGRWTARLRAMAQEFRTGFDELARQAELDELKREVDALRRANPLNEMRQPLRDLDRDIRSAVSPSPLAAKPPAPALPALPPDPGPAPVALETAPEPEPVPARPAAGGAAS
jgi:sec-independent protein translocase protein TatB